MRAESSPRSDTITAKIYKDAFSFEVEAEAASHPVSPKYRVHRIRVEAVHCAAKSLGRGFGSALDPSTTAYLSRIAQVMPQRCCRARWPCSQLVETGVHAEARKAGISQSLRSTTNFQVGRLKIVGPGFLQRLKAFVSLGVVCR